jgi:hypothetical protein
MVSYLSLEGLSFSQIKTSSTFFPNARAIRNASGSAGSYLAFSTATIACRETPISVQRLDSPLPFFKPTYASRHTKAQAASVLLELESWWGWTSEHWPSPIFLLVSFSSSDGFVASDS